MTMILSQNATWGPVFSDRTHTRIKKPLRSGHAAIVRYSYSAEQNLGSSELRADRDYPLAADYCAEDFGLGFSSLSPLFDNVMPCQPRRIAIRSGNFVSL